MKTMPLDIQAEIVIGLGGALRAPALPSREEFSRQLDREDAATQRMKDRGGCAEEMYSFGRGCQFVRCGSLVHAFGRTTVAKCRRCNP